MWTANGVGLQGGFRRHSCAPLKCRLPVAMVEFCPSISNHVDHGRNGAAKGLFALPATTLSFSEFCFCPCTAINRIILPSAHPPFETPGRSTEFNAPDYFLNCPPFPQPTGCCRGRQCTPVIAPGVGPGKYRGPLSPGALVGPKGRWGWAVVPANHPGTATPARAVSPPAPDEPSLGVSFKVTKWGGTFRVP